MRMLTAGFGPAQRLALERPRRLRRRGKGRCREDGKTRDGGRGGEGGEGRGGREVGGGYSCARVKRDDAPVVTSSGRRSYSAGTKPDDADSRRPLRDRSINPPHKLTPLPTAKAMAHGISDPAQSSGGFSSSSSPP